MIDFPFKSEEGKKRVKNIKRNTRKGVNIFEKMLKFQKIYKKVKNNG